MRSLVKEKPTGLKCTSSGWPLAVIAACLPVGCADDEPQDHGMMMCGLQENCVGNLQFSHGLTVDGEDGVFSVEFVAGNPPASTTPTWDIAVTDANGAPVDDAVVTVSAWSVDCMHEGPTPPSEVHAAADGTYTIEPVFAHGGPWETVLQVRADGAEDTVTAFFCVDAPGHGEPGVQGHGAPDGGGAHDNGAGHDG